MPHPAQPAGVVPAQGEAWYQNLDGVDSQSWNAQNDLFQVGLTFDTYLDLDLRHVPAQALRIDIAGSPWNHLMPTSPARTHILLPPGAKTATLTIPSERQILVTIDGGSSDLMLEVYGDTESKSSRLAVILSRSVKKFNVHDCTVEIRPHIHSNIDVVEAQLVRCVSEISCRVSIAKVEGGAVKINGGFLDKLIVKNDQPIQINGEVGTLTVDQSSTSQIASLGPNSVITISDLLLESLTIDPLAEVLLSGSVRDLTIQGAGRVRITKSASRLKFEDPPPRLVLAPYAVLADTTGRLHIESAAHAMIMGPEKGSNGFELIHLPDEASHFSGVAIKEFTVSVSVSGIRMINQLRENARVATPAVHDQLPGMNLRFWRRRTVTIESLDSEYANSLAALSRLGNSPASTRTRLQWCAYRVRQDVTHGCVERTVLRSYRLIGYGERPMPAMILYMITAFLMTVIANFQARIQLDTPGVVNFFESYASWLISPLHVLNLGATYQPDGGLQEPALTIARVLVAIPFATGVLAMRKYVKDDQRE